jgi:hypothetical protein
MKLERFARGACAAMVACMFAFASGCAGTARATAPAVDPNAVDTTELMSAQVEGPAPKVGKAHVSFDAQEALGAPKDGRPSDGSHRAGNFGTTK